MSNIGNLLLTMMGDADPRQQLLQAAMGGTPATPDGGGATPGAAGGQPGAAAPAQPQQQPAAMQPPPDLGILYDKLMQRQERARGIDSGIGLIASAFAQPENRNIPLNAMGVGKGGSDAFGGMEDLMEMQKFAQANRARSEMLQNVPTIAQQYGIDERTARYLLESGSLDEVIVDRERGQNGQVVTRADGSMALVNVRDGSIIQELGAAEAPGARETQIVQTSDGRDVMVYKDDGTIVREIGGPSKPSPTTDQQELAQINEERAASGLAPISMDEYQLRQGPRGTNITNNVGGEFSPGLKKAEEAAGGDLNTERETAKASRDLMQTVRSAGAALNAPGGVITGSKLSPYELEGRKILADILGVPDEQASNTETFLSSIKTAVLPQVKALGTGNSISNADRDYIDKMMGGSIEVNEDSIREILRIQEQAARNNIIRWNKKAADIVAKNPDSLLQPIEVPDLSDFSLGSVNPVDAAEIIKDDITPEDMRAFDDIYGVGMADYYRSKR